MICPRVQAARGSRHYSNCLWPTQLWHSLLRTCGDSCLLGRRGGCWGCWGCWDFWDRWDVTHPYWPFGPLDHWTTGTTWPLLDRYWTTGPARRPWPSRAATQEHRPQPSTTVHNRPQHEIRSRRASRRQLTESVRKRCDVSSFLRITHAANR